MIGPLNGPWLLVAALLLLAAAALRSPRPRGADFWLAFAIAAGGAAARIVWGIWGPLHINGQGPLWIRGALDPEPLSSYGPGYFELFGWLARQAAHPDRAIFAADAVLSALHAPLFYAAARLVGVGGAGALAGALVLAADPVTVRTAASEGYFSSLIALVLAVQVSLALWVRAERRADRFATLALGAACLFAAAAARIHPMAYVPLALSPLVVLGAAPIRDWRSRLAMTASAAAAIGAAVLLTSATTVLLALESSPMTRQTMGAPALGEYGPLLAAAAAVLLLHRWTEPRWLPLLGVLSLALMLATQASFLQHPLWQLCYQRVFWPGILLGGAALLPRRLWGAAWALPVAAAVALVPFSRALPLLGEPNTEQLEYRFLEETLGAAPRDCTVAGVSRVGNRIWEIPSYLVPSSAGGAGMQRTVQTPSDLDAAAPGGCLLYVRSSLCSSVEARELCDAVERAVPLERVASRAFPAAPSYTGLPYDRQSVEVVVFRASARNEARQAGAEAGGGREPATVSDGAPITPDFAQGLYRELAKLHASDGCRLVAFDTARFRIRVGLEAPSGARHEFEIATARSGNAGRRSGSWALAVPDALERDCGATLAGLERALSGTEAPRRALQWSLPTENTLIVATFIVLIAGTVAVLYREARTRRPSPVAVLALMLVWAAALGLRLTISPRTFLHEYYHVAETAAGYLSGEGPPLYGATGPSLFRAVGAALDRPHDVSLVFLTNAVLSSLAIPAVALLDLAWMRSWPRAITAAVLLCVLPHHLRFSAAEDLFVQAVTFGLWALALAALYLRSRRIGDAILAVLALSLAMQTRPEMLLFPAALAAMVLLVEPRSWRMLVAPRTLLALAVLAVLLVPRVVELGEVLGEGSPSPGLPPLSRYFGSLVLFWKDVTPPAYWVLLAVGAAWTLFRKPGLLAWVALVYSGYALFSQSMFDNAPFRLRSQILPTSFVVLIAAGAASAWMEVWGPRRRQALAAGALVLAITAAATVELRRGFVTALFDQQLEWAFLDRTVSRLPDRATLLTAVEVGQRNFDAFPTILLSREGKRYDVIDVRRAAGGDVAWPPPGEDLLYYQGMFCYFAAQPGESAPAPMTRPCLAVHERYAAEPLFVETLDGEGYSEIPYAERPWRIGFFRLRASR